MKENEGQLSPDTGPALKRHEKPMTLRLTAVQRRVLEGIVYGALNAGACKDGLTEEEGIALRSISARLRAISARLLGRRADRAESPHRTWHGERK